MYGTRPMTVDQQAFIKALQARLKLNDDTLNVYLASKFEKTLPALNIKEASTLIDQLQTWKAVPAELRRAMGQMDLF